MFKPRTTAATFLSTAMLVSACLSPTGRHAYARAQQSTVGDDDRGRGISLYNQGHDKEAIEALRLAVKRRKDDVSAWHYLGLSLARAGKAADARKAHEKAAKLGEQRLDVILDSTPFEKLGAGLKVLKPSLLEAAESADEYLKLSSKPSKSKTGEWTERAEMLREYVQLFDSDSSGDNPFRAYAPQDVTVKARILSRPEPQYTDEARQNHVSGTIVLRAVFSFDGKVRALRVIKGLPSGLTAMALNAARHIKFIPATIDGKPVSQYIQIEYNFNIY